MVVLSDGLTIISFVQFTIHSDLGRVVQAVIREFERRPPHLAGESAEGSSATSHKGKNGKSPQVRY